jgi:hypothetical protein
MYKLSKRGKGRYKTDKSLKDSYAFYVEKTTPKESLTKFSDSSTRIKPLSKDAYKKVAEKILTRIMEAMLIKSMTFHLPYRLGEMRIRKMRMNMGLLYKSNNLKTDWGHYQKTGKFIKHLNEHRDNCRYGFYWLCKKGPKGKNLYKFQALRQHKRNLARLLKTTNIDYFD